MQAQFLISLDLLIYIPTYLFLNSILSGILIFSIDLVISIGKFRLVVSNFFLVRTVFIDILATRHYLVFGSSQMPAPVPDRSSGLRVAHSTSAIELVTRNENVEDVQAQVEKLGRQRPEVFKTFWHELGFCFSLLASMLMAVCDPANLIQGLLANLLSIS